MTAVMAAGAAANIIGALWSVLAVIYGTNPQEQSDGFATGLLIAVAGTAITILAAWRENRR